MAQNKNDGNGANAKGLESDIGNGSSGGGYVDPEIARNGIKPIWETEPGEPGSGIGNAAQSSGEPAQAKRGRGRPPGSGNKAKSTGQTETSLSVTVTSIEKLLISIHVTLAIVANQPGLALDPDESKALAKAIADVQAQYQITLNPKTAAWMNLMLVALPMYGTRVIGLYLAQANNTVENPPQPQTPQPQAQAKPETKATSSVFDVAGYRFDPTDIKVRN